MDVKSIFASKTVWGAIAMLAPTIAGLFGLSMTSADAADAVSQTTAIIDQVLTYGGFLLAMWGRMTATTKVKLLG